MGPLTPAFPDLPLAQVFPDRDPTPQGPGAPQPSAWLGRKECSPEILGEDVWPGQGEG